MGRVKERAEGSFASRRNARHVAKLAGKSGEPLSPDDWEAYFRVGAQPSSRIVKRIFRVLPSDPRCGFCGAPFTGMGGALVRPFGFRPSRKNPNLCATCIESSPPGGATWESGILFADLRGFTTLSETLSPVQSSAMLRRFYGQATRVLFPEALIDKLIGDEVMALYIPVFMRPGTVAVSDDDRRFAANMMVRHARELLREVGYGTPSGPEVQLGIGLDFGEVFLGNVGGEHAHDFTAVGDVVNTAARLQSQAAGGEIVLSARLGAHVDGSLGEVEHLTIKGKAEPVRAYRLTWA